MTHHHVTSADLAIHGDRLAPSTVARVKTIALRVAICGIVVSLYLLFSAPEKIRGCFAYSWLFAFYFFLTLSIGGCFWTLLHNVTNSGWGTSVRRTFENLGSTYPWMFLFGLPLLCPKVQQYLYEWMNIQRASIGNVSEFLEAHGSLLYQKYGFLNLPFWYGRVIFCGIGLSLVIIGLRRISTAQDTDPNPGAARLFQARFHSTYTLILLALTLTFTSFDFLLGMDYNDLPAMWGVYLFGGSALNSLAVIILVCAWLKSQGHLKHVISNEHFHIMGKLLLAFTIFWACISFPQYFLIWHAGITGETSYFLIQNSGNWNTAMLVLAIGHFVVPFVVLLQPWLKKSPQVLAILAAYMLCMHVLDLYLIVIPERGISLGNIRPEVFGGIQVSIPGAFWGDIVAFATIGSAFLFFLLRALGQHSLYPNRDPRILESANLSN